MRRPRPGLARCGSAAGPARRDGIDALDGDLPGAQQRDAPRPIRRAASAGKARCEDRRSTVNRMLTRSSCAIPLRSSIAASSRSRRARARLGLVLGHDDRPSGGTNPHPSPPIATSRRGRRGAPARSARQGYSESRRRGGPAGARLLDAASPSARTSSGASSRSSPGASPPEPHGPDPQPHEPRHRQPHRRRAAAGPRACAPPSSRRGELATVAAASTIRTASRLAGPSSSSTPARSARELLRRRASLDLGQVLLLDPEARVREPVRRVRRRS